MDTNRELLDRLYGDVLEGGNLDELASLVHDDLRVSDVAFAGGHEGVDEYAGHVEMLRAAFGDVETSYSVLGEGEDSITVEYSLEGTHTGPFLGVEATGNEVSFAGIDVLAIEDGRIASIRTAFDLLGLLTDVGAVDPPFE